MSNLSFTGGASGYRIVERRPFQQAEHYYTALVLVALAVWISMWVRHSRFGQALRAIRDDEEAAADSGVNPFAYKLEAHALAAALTGAAGGVYARYAAFIHPAGVFAFHTSIVILLMPIIGGLNTIWGPVIGGAVYGVIEEELVANFPGIHLLLYDALVILIILFEPGGVMGLVGRLSRGLRSRKGGLVAAILTVERLTKYFAGLAALKDVSFEIEEGDLVGLIGPNARARQPSSASLPGRSQLLREKSFFAAGTSLA